MRADSRSSADTFERELSHEHRVLIGAQQSAAAAVASFIGAVVEAATRYFVAATRLFRLWASFWYSAAFSE